MRKLKYLSVLSIIIVGFIPLLDLFYPGLPLTHDGQDHVARVASFYQNLLDGNIIPRWAGNLNWGYGHPILIFLYPLPSYTASLFHFLGFSLIDSTKIVFGFAFLLSGLTMYLWTKNLFGSHAGIVAGILYMFAPYRFVDLYVRGALGEHVAFIFPPLIFYFMYRIYQSFRHSGESRLNRDDSRISTSVRDSGQARMTINNWYLIGGSLSLAGLLLSHNAISLMFFPLIFLYVIYLSFTSEESRSLPRHLRGGVAPAAHLGGVISMVLLGFGLAAFFWLPAFFEGKYTLRDIVTAGEYSSRFVRLEQFFYGPWSFGGTGQFSVQLGIVYWMIVVGSVVLLFFKKTAKEHKKFIVGLLLIVFVALFLMISQSSNLWQNISLLQKFQFPWRLLSVVVFSSSVLGALVVSAVPKNHKKYVVGIVIFMILFFSKDYIHAKGYLYKEDSFFSGIYNGTTDTGESSPIWSVRFMEKKPKAHIQVISGEAVIKELSRKSTVHVYGIDATEKSRILENTLYFPGWEVYMDGMIVKDVEFQDPANRGLMTFFVEEGKHNVEIKFGETKLRLFADMISATSLVVIIFLSGIRKRKEV